MSSSSLSPPKQCGGARPTRSPPRFIETCSICSRPSENEGASPRTFCREDTLQHSNKAPQGTRDLDVEETSCTEFDDAQHKDEHFKLNRNNKVARTQQWLDNSNHSAFSFNSQSSQVRASTTSVAHPVQNLSQFAVTCIIVNYISAGYILLPHAFAQAGIGLAILCFVFVSAQSYLTTIFLLETCARAEALEHSHSREIPIDEDNYTMAIRNHLYGITWTFAVVFGQNLSEQLPILGSENEDYQLYIAIFLAVSIPLSCLDILDQILVQMGFLLFRMIMVFTMIVTLVVAYTNPSRAYFDSRPSGAALDLGGGNAFVSFGSLIAVLQTCIFATAFQFSIPGVAGISDDRKQIVSVVRGAVVFVFCTNSIVAVLTAYYFGPEDCKESNNLNWLGFHGLSDSVGSRIVSNYVVVMAAVDSLAVYPLNAIPLGEGLMAAIYGKETEVVMSKSKWRRVAFRLLASLPQGIGALWVHDLGGLAKYAGIFTLLSYTTCPAFLHVRSFQKMTEQHLPTKTHYTHSFLSHPTVAYVLITCSLLLILGVAIDASL